MKTPYYEEDGITIYHSDFRELISDLYSYIDIVVTDPPYGKEVSIEKMHNAKDSTLYWHQVEHAGKGWQKSILSLDIPTVLFGANFYSSHLPSHPGWIVWDKQADGFKQGSPVELAWTNFLNNIRIFRLNYRGFTTRKDPKFHPMQKPLALMKWIMSLSEFPDSGTILDPFMGSGTTLVAAKELGFRAIGIEIEERYCEVAVKRLSQVIPTTLF
jgi:DNA modification methylase